MAELPQGRPNTELTPGMYTIAKSRICAIFGEAAELTQKITPPKYSTILLLDKRLQAVHEQIPEGMRVRPLEECMYLSSLEYIYPCAEPIPPFPYSGKYSIHSTSRSCFPFVFILSLESC